MPVRLNSTGGGSVTLDVPSTAGTFTATVPANTGTLVTTGSAAAVTPAMLTQPLTLMTAQNSTSGTFIDFTGIPSWVRRVTLSLLGVSTNGSGRYRFQLGTSAGVVTSGYTGANTVFGGSTLITSSQSAGFEIFSDAAANTHDGVVRFIRVSTAIESWICDGLVARTNSPVTYIVAGSIALPGALDRVRVTTSTGTDVFDAGSINVMYEG